MNAHASRHFQAANPGRNVADILMIRPQFAVPVIVILALAARVICGAGTPLWFDETFSAVIASQPDVVSLMDWCRVEIGGPAYYVALWGWAQVFGTSATGLRSLSFVASILACGVIAARGHPDRHVRLLWAGLIALWLPGIDPATNARCYALLLLASAVQAITYLRLMDAPDRSRAFAWTVASVLMILTHNYSALIAVVGGVIFLAVHRWRAVRCWPALAPLVPLCGWMAFQLPALLRFSGQGMWYPTFGLLDLALAPSEFFGSIVIGFAVMISVAVGIAKGWRGDHTVAERALAASGLVALSILLIIAMVRPSFTWRYAIAFGPSILFALVLWVRTLEKRFPAAPALLLTLFAATTLGQTGNYLTHRTESYRWSFNLQQPSAWLAASGAHHLAFLWDSPTGTMSDQVRMNEVVGYFLRLNGRHEEVTMLRAPAQSSTSQMVVDVLAADPTIDSIVWTADELVPGTRSLPNRAMLTAAGWTCHDFGRETMHVLTCHSPAS